MWNMIKVGIEVFFSNICFKDLDLSIELMLNHHIFLSKE